MANEEIVVQLRAEIGDLQSKLKTAQDSISSFDKKASASLKESINPMNQLETSLKGMVAGYVSLAAAAQLVGRAFSESLKLDSTKTAMNQVFGSAQLGEAQFQRVADKADELGLNMLSLTETYKDFAGATIASGVSLETTNKVFDAVANASSKLKLSADDTTGALRAMSQMFSKGTVQSEELRGQLAERLPGAYALAAKAMNMTTEELGKQLAAGKILASDLLPKLADLLNKTYNGKGVDSLQSSLNRLQNTFTKALTDGAIGDFFKGIVDGATWALTNIEKLKKGIDKTFDPQKSKDKEFFNSEQDFLTKLFEKKDTKGLNKYIKDVGAQLNVKTLTMYNEKWYQLLDLMKLADTYKNDLLKPPAGGGNKEIIPIGSMTALKDRLKELNKELSLTTNTKKQITITANIIDVEKKIETLQNKLDVEKFRQTYKNPFDIKTISPEALINDPYTMADPTELYPVQAINAYTSEMNMLTAASDNLFKITDEHYGKVSSFHIPTEEEKAAALQRTNEVLAAQTMLVGTLASGFEQMFTTILEGGQNAFQGILNALKQLMIKLAAAIVAAAILFVLSGGLSSGGNALEKIGEIAKTAGGLGFNPYTLFSGGGDVKSIAMPSNATGQGGYQIDIMGDKMRMLLDNQAVKNSRVV
jgi:tape measure domain-containing protein